MPKPPKPPSTQPPAPGSGDGPGLHFVDVTLHTLGSKGTVTRINIAGHEFLVTGDTSAHTSQPANTDLSLSVATATGLHVIGTECRYTPVPIPPGYPGDTLSDVPGVPSSINFPPHTATTVRFDLKPDLTKPGSSDL